ncbi:MAG TPA: EscU/YscU/HrcU family type III secretion system export apparatus switch protein [Terriglobia bacterium]
MASGSGERTEKATARHRKQARDKGQFAYSQELTGAITLAASAVTAFYYLESPAGFRSLFASLLEQATTGDNSQLIHQAGVYFLFAVAPVFTAALVAALAGNFIQGLPVFAPEKAGLRFENLNPAHALSRLKGQLSWMQWLKLVAMVSVVALIAWKMLAASWNDLVTLPARSIDASNAVIRSLTIRVASSLIAVVVILAIADFFIQRRKFEQSIKQTKAEVKDDMKATEGSPLIKGKIKSIQRDSARRMMARVKEADVIVTNPGHQPVALEYKPDRMGAPRLIAKGRQIKDLGLEHDIPMIENGPLASALYSSVDIEQEIPPELYKDVAEVLAGVYKEKISRR